MAKEKILECKYCSNPLTEENIVGKSDATIFFCKKCNKINFGEIEEYFIEIDIEGEKNVSRKKPKQKGEKNV